jgi:disease resistance protein RPM1
MKELPAAIIRLENLVHLFTDCDVKYPDGMAKMQALQTLKQIGTSLQSSNFFQELSQLKNLRKLRLEFDYDPTEVIKKHMKVITSSICQLSILSLDSLRIGREEDEETEIDLSLDDNFLLQQWCPAPRSLRELEICLIILYVPDWVGPLVNLQRLFLWVKKARQEDLFTLGGLPILSSLVIGVEGEVESSRMLTVSGANGFPCLKSFFFSAYELGVELMFLEGSMPKLEFLSIYFNAVNTSSGAFELGIQNLPCLDTLDCTLYGVSESSDWIIQAAKAAMERATATHRNLPGLAITTRKYYMNHWMVGQILSLKQDLVPVLLSFFPCLI